VAVAEELNFSRAAFRLVMTQPSLSRQIHDLETELGTELFERHSKRLALTAAGEFFLEQARSLLAAAEQAVLQTRQLGRGEIGQLALGYNTDQVGCGLLPAILQSFRQQYPNVTVTLHSLEMSHQMEALRNREIDLGFTIRMGKTAFNPAYPELCYTNLSDDALVAVLPSGHPLTEKAQVSLKELAGEPFIWSSAQLNPRTGDYTPTLFEEAGFLPEKFVTGLSRKGNRLDPVAQGLGVSLAHHADLPYKGTVYRPLDEEFLGCHSLLWSGENSSASLKNFIELAQAQMQPGCTRFHF
jgi:DNA-binding transcriptional LysR family regulator